MKRLSLSLPSALSSQDSTANPTFTLLHHKEEDGDFPSVPYADGPIQIIPGIWIGSEDNARDWKGLLERGIKSILNVAKEVASPFDAFLNDQTLHSAASTLNSRDRWQSDPVDPTYYPPHLPSGRPAMHYLKLQWSHGQQNLVQDGFRAAMAFVDAALKRGEGSLIHCQCGISRSATMAIALVMRAAAEGHPSVPREVWTLPGTMQGAYSFVKEKSPHIGPNMSLIYQLLEYEKKLEGDKGIPDSDESLGADDEEEWGRRRLMLDEASDNEASESESTLVMQEAKALDKAMEDRIVARKGSASSMSSTGSGLGMGPAWRSRYDSRKRRGSVASNNTNSSFISENLVEEDEEQDLLGIGRGFDIESHQTSSPNEERDGTPCTVSSITTPSTARPPPSAPVRKSSFSIPPPPEMPMRPTFNLPSKPPRNLPLPRSLSTDSPAYDLYSPFSTTVTSEPWVSNTYPPARHSDHVEIYKSTVHGQIRVPDTLQWLEEHTDEADERIRAQGASNRIYLAERSGALAVEDCPVSILDVPSQEIQILGNNLPSQHAASGSVGSEPKSMINGKDISIHGGNFTSVAGDYHDHTTVVLEESAKSSRMLNALQDVISRLENLFSSPEENKSKKGGDGPTIRDSNISHPINELHFPSLNDLSQPLSGLDDGYCIYQTPLPSTNDPTHSSSSQDAQKPYPFDMPVLVPGIVHYLPRWFAFSGGWFASWTAWTSPPYWTWPSLL